MRNNKGDDGNFISEESDNNIFNRNDNAAVANSDVEIIDVNKWITEVAALKMFVTEQLYIIKQSVGSPKTSVCNCSSKNNIYVDSLHDQINYLREENKMKNSIIQSLLSHSPSENVNDKGDNSSPISKEAENDNFNNNLDNMFDKAVDDNFVDTKENYDRNHHDRIDNNRSTSSSNSKETVFILGMRQFL